MAGQTQNLKILRFNFHYYTTLIPSMTIVFLLMASPVFCPLQSFFLAFIFLFLVYLYIFASEFQ